MADDDLGSSVVDAIAAPARQAYKKINDLASHVPFLSGKGGFDQPMQNAHDKQIDNMNKAAAQKSVADANKSFIPTQTAAQKKAVMPAKATAKVSVKSMPRKK